MKLEPFGNKVILSPCEEEQYTAGGIALPFNNKESYNKGIVLAVGPEVEHIKEGDVVIFAAYSGYNRIKVQDKEQLILTASEILARISQ